MIVAFAEDRSVFVFENTEDACREFEGIDVESGVVIFFGESGTPLRPVFTEPNRQGRSFLVEWVVSGAYRLDTDPGAEQDPLWLALLEASHLEPNSLFKSLDELRRQLAENGAIVDPPFSSA